MLDEYRVSMLSVPDASGLTIIVGRRSHVDGRNTIYEIREMKRIIEDVLQAEEKVGVILRQAREKGSEIRRSAENEISERMNEAKQKGREIVQTTVEDAKKDAERISAEKLEQADREKDAMLNDRTDVIDGLVTDICNLVMTEGR
jgi:vacuolar-type H+-ATPase subunit H